MGGGGKRVRVSATVNLMLVCFIEDYVSKKLKKKKPKKFNIFFIAFPNMKNS